MGFSIRSLTVCAVVLGLAAGSLAQDPIVLRDTTIFYDDEGAFLVRVDEDQVFSSADFNDAAFLEGFRPVGEGDFNFGLSSSAIWYRFILKNTTGSHWLLRAGNPRAQEVTLFVVRGPGAVDSTHLALDRPFDERAWHNNHYLFDLDLPADREQTFFLRVTSKHAMNIRPLIGTVRSFFVHNHHHDIWAGFYLGFILLMVLYNLFILFSTLDRSYLYYVIYVLCIGLTVSMRDGYPFELFWGDTPALNPYMGLLDSLAGAFAALFTMSFLRTRQFVPGWHKGLQVMLVLYVIAGTVVLAGHPREAARIHQLTAVCSLYMLVVAIRVYRQGYKPARFYLLAWSCLVVGVVLYVISSGGFIDVRGLDIDVMQIGTAAEALLLSFALADRFNQYRAEREALVRQQKDMLETMVAERTVALEREKKKSEDLLHNILPVQVAMELRDHGRVEARGHEQVTVMFTDFKDFTRIGQQLPAASLIREIDLLFSAFDNIIRKYGIEKIKTIGDAYMCAGGLPKPCATHAQDVVRAGLEIRDFMLKDQARRIGSGEIPFEVRIGIHSGPVVAGIVGVDKFAYDIWGATVNLASRMEGSGVPGRVNISGATYAIIKDEFACTHRGKILTKDKVEVDMYFVEPK